MRRDPACKRLEDVRLLLVLCETSDAGNRRCLGCREHIELDRGVEHLALRSPVILSPRGCIFRDCQMVLVGFEPALPALFIPPPADAITHPGKPGSRGDSPGPSLRP